MSGSSQRRRRELLRTSRSSRWARWLVAGLALCGLEVGCDGAVAGGGPTARQSAGRGRAGPSGRGQAEREPIPLELVRLERAEVVRYYETSGTLRALKHAELRPRQAGIVSQLLAEEGDHVKRGQVLARLDARELALMARRDELMAKHRADDLARLQRLDGSGAISDEELALSRQAADEAKAAAKLSRQQARLTTLQAPFAGVITRRHLDVGALAGAGTAVYEIADVSALELELFVPEREALQIGQDAEVGLFALDDRAFTGRVVRRAPTVDTTTGTVKFVVRCDEVPAGVVPGTFVRARVVLDRRLDALSVPRRAIFDFQGQPHVWKVADGKARRAKVEVGLKGDERVEILDGLRTDDPIIADVRGGLTEGMPIRDLREPAAPKGQGAPAGPAAPAAGQPSGPKTSSNPARRGPRSPS